MQYAKILCVNDRVWDGFIYNKQKQIYLITQINYSLLLTYTDIFFIN